jgi:hypothetical protein
MQVQSPFQPAVTVDPPKKMKMPDWNEDEDEDEEEPEQKKVFQTQITMKDVLQSPNAPNE